MSTSACVLSIEPVVTQAEATFDARLLGRWVELSERNPDRADVTRGEGNEYSIMWTTEGKPVRLRGRLGVLGGRQVLDVWPEPDDAQWGPYKDMFFPGHLLVVLTVGGDRVTTAILEPDTLHGAVERGALPLQLSTSSPTRPSALFGRTPDLRRALGPYLSRAAVLSTPGVWQRVTP